ncbi:MAG: hypothetical protein P9X22_02315 [Candidatus Zapsychrus exili]|nr:hypothetical protein [Candidatus Zapsychrus exili]
MWETIKQICISFLMVIITVQLSLRKFRTEKWWEKKAEAYAKIIDAIHHLKNYCEQKLNAEYEHSELSPERENELWQQYKTALRELARAIDVGSFIITNEAVEALETYQNRPELSWNENSLWSVIEHDLKYTKKCLHDFKIIAKNDLRIK